MRGFLFDLVARVFAFKLLVVKFVSDKLLGLIGNVGYFLLKSLDKKKLDLYNELQPGEEPSELAAQSIELRLLASAGQVRDHARENDEWTDRHTDALNAIGDALMVEAGWEEDHVHAYLKEIVESIDGLEYGTEEW